MPLNTEEIKVDGYQKVIYAENQSAGLRAIISVHNTNRGPACGGLRLLPYPTRDDALNDVLRLSRGMSYKSALANIGFGGGKSVIIADPSEKNETLLEAFGEFVDTFGGMYITAKDMNINSDDLRVIKGISRHVLGIDGELGSSGDPSPVTARGVLRGLEATLEHVYGSPSMEGKHFAIQGLGAVGFDLARQVHERGGKITASDTNTKALKLAEEQLGATIVQGDAIYSVDCDVFMPCAIGGILTPETISALKCKAVVGCANNQLATPKEGAVLKNLGIVYAPDYAVNSGGIINVYQEHIGYDKQKALTLADGIYETTQLILERAKQSNAPTSELADSLAEERLLLGKASSPLRSEGLSQLSL